MLKVTLNIWKRKDAMRGEVRHLANISGCINMDFNEPSRSVESLDMYPDARGQSLGQAQLAELQRAPEYFLWQVCILAKSTGRIIYTDSHFICIDSHLDAPVYDSYVSPDISNE